MRHSSSGCCTRPQGWQLRARTAFVTLAMIMGAACRQASVPNVPATAAGESVAAPAPSIDSVIAMGGTDTEWVRTPGAGLLHRSCVHEIPTGASVRFDTVQLSDGRRYVLPPCRVILARVVNARRESGMHPSAGQGLQRVFDVTIGARERPAVVIVGDSTKVYTRRADYLVAVKADAIAVGDELEVWFGHGVDRDAARLSPRPPVFAPTHVIVRR